MKQAIVGSIFVLAYVLIATEWVHRVIVALGGAGLMLLLRLVDADDAFHSHEFGIDWNVIFLLLGMMLIVGVMRHTGLFEYLAIWSAKRARGQPFRVLVMLITITAVASALLDNVTTVLLVAPVTVLLTERLGLPTVPFLIAEAMSSNIGGTATLVGDPPNIIIASQADLSYVDFLANLLPLVIVLMVVFVFLARFLFRKALVHHPDRVAEVMALDERESITDPALMVRSLVVLAVVTVGFVFHGLLHYEPSVVALLGGGTLLLAARRDPGPFLREVEWPTLAFFMGLFVMVGALVKVGVIHDLATQMVNGTNGSVLLSVVILVVASGLLSGLVDNIPYVATTAPLVHELIRVLPAGSSGTVLWWALAIGADLGGNATTIGASANVVVVGLAARAGYRIRFFEFLKYGSVVTVVTLAISLLYLWVRYFLIG